MQAEGTLREFTGTPEVINLCKADLKHVDTGMYLFTDNTLSYQLQDGKTIRAVVLGKQGKTIYALLPDEACLEYKKDRDYREFAPQVLFENAEARCTKIMPPLVFLMNAHFFHNELNQALEKAGQMKLSGLYWSWDNGRPYFRYDPIRGEKHLITKGCSAKARFLLEMKLK